MSSKTRLFHLSYDAVKIPRMAKDPRKECDGVHFANGLVALDMGIVYESMAELERNIKAYGSMTLTYLDEAGKPEEIKEAQDDAPSRIPPRQKYRSASLREQKLNHGFYTV